MDNEFANEPIVPTSLTDAVSTDVPHLGNEIVDNFPAQPYAKKAYSWSWVGLIVGIGLAIYLVVVPALSMLISSFTPQPVSRTLTDMSFVEYIRLHTVSGVVMLLFLAVGASIGSFLNVVIYRLPRGMRLLWPPSSCPKCGYKISGRDNLPILAWIGLQGKCRQCKVSISMRYPIIEFIVASLFVLLFYRELLSGGSNLPIREPNTFKGIVWILLYTKWDLVSIYFLHTMILSVLLAWGMINYDCFRVPVIARLAVVVLSSICVINFPFLNPASNGLVISGISPGLAACLGGLLAGAVGGYALQKLFIQPIRVDESKLADSQPMESATDAQRVPVEGPQGDKLGAIESLANIQLGTGPNEIERHADANPNNETDLPQSFKPLELYGTAAQKPQDTSDALYSMLLIGSILGPSTVLSITAFAALLGGTWYVVRRVGGPLPAVPITLHIFVVTVIHVALWRQSTYIPLSWWPKPDSGMVLILVWVVLLVVISAVAGMMRKILLPSSQFSGHRIGSRA